MLIEVEFMSEKTNNRSIVNKYTNSFLHIVFFLIIFVSDDTFTFGTNSIFSFILFKYLIYLILTIFLIYKVNKQVLIIPTKSNIMLLFCIFAVFLTAALNLDITGGYIYQIWLIFLAFLITQLFSSKDIIFAYCRFVYFLSIVSLVVFALASIFPVFLNVFPVFINPNDVEFYNLGVCVVFKDVGELRNTSIFREPGVFMIYLCIAIIFELFCADKTNKLKLIVFVMALFSTFSTAAFIVFGVICFSYLFVQNKNLKIMVNKMVILIIGCIIISAIFLSSDLYSRVFDKLGKDSVNDGSALARGASVFVNYHIFLDNPLKGIGITQFPNTFARYSLQLFQVSMDSGNNTNTITTIFAIYGSLFGLLFLYTLIMLVRKLSNSIISQCGLFLVMLMLFSNEDLRYSLFAFVLLFWGLISDPAKKLKINNG